jgi:hypothetical protein
MTIIGSEKTSITALVTLLLCAQCSNGFQLTYPLDITSNAIHVIKRSTLSKLSLVSSQPGSHNYYHRHRQHMTSDSTAGSPAPFFPQEDEEEDTTKSNQQSMNARGEARNKQVDTTTDVPTKSFLQALDDLGRSLKGKAAAASANTSGAKKQYQKYLYLLQSCLLYIAFILYRGYRGFFVILPAVFRETFSRLEAAMDKSPFDDDDDVSDVNFYATSSGSSSDVTSSKRGKVAQWRTRVTVSVLSSIVIASYVLGGIGRVVVRMLNTIRTGKGVSESFAAAAEEQENNEIKLFNKVSKKNNNNNSSSGSSTSINGR